MITLKQRHLKQYPHFDAPLKMADALKLVNSPKAVSQHSFFPFIVDEKKYQPYRTPSTSSNVKKQRPEPKIRPLRSTARRDAAIFAGYRQILAERYERYLEDNRIGSCVTAYRSIPNAPSASGKSNIHFSHEVFSKITELENSVAISLDISSFFENIDHSILRKRWCEILDVDSLPPDHWAVFKNITRYAWVERPVLYKKLDLVTKVEKRGIEVTIPMRRDLPIVLCSGKTLRELDQSSKKVDGSKLIHQNDLCRGIPQGSPISDMLANIYLIEFDKKINALAKKYGGIYRRYSDDIVLIVPGGLQVGASIRAQVRREIQTQGCHLRIKAKKTHTIAFKKIRNGYQLVNSKRNARAVHGLEYLGFRFDGEKIYFRDSTLSRHRRKVRKLVKKEAKSVVNRYKSKPFKYISEAFNEQKLIQIAGRCPRSKYLHERRKRSFHSYAHQAQSVFGDSLGSKLFEKINSKKWVREDKEKYLKKYFEKAKALHH